MTDEQKHETAFMARYFADQAEVETGFTTQAKCERVSAYATARVLDTSPQYTAEDHDRVRGYREAVRNG